MNRIEMATSQLTASSIKVPARNFTTFQGLRPLSVKFTSVEVGGRFSKCSFRGLVVKAATVVATKMKPTAVTLIPFIEMLCILQLNPRVQLKIKTAEEKTAGGIFIPAVAQTKPQTGEVVAVGEGKSVGKTKVGITVKTGTQVIYSKYAGTEVEFNGSNHLIVKEDDIVGILETDEIKDLKPLNDRVLIQVAEAEEKTTGGLLLTETTKEKPSIGMVMAVGSGPLEEDGSRKPLAIAPGNIVLYPKYAGNEFKGSDDTNYITLRHSDVMAVLS